MTISATDREVIAYYKETINNNLRLIERYSKIIIDSALNNVCLQEVIEELEKKQQQELTNELL